MTTEKRGVIIRVDGTKEAIIWTDENISNIMHNAVGGYFERVQLLSKGFEMYVNEDGMRLDLAPNAIATSFYIEETNVIVPPICGDIILIGATDNVGNNDGLTPIQISMIYDFAPFVVFTEIIEDGEVSESDLSDEPENLDEHTLERFLALEREDRLKDSLTIEPIQGEEDNV